MDERLRSVISSLHTSFPIDAVCVFGSFGLGDETDDSDIDILVEFEPEHIPGLLGIARLEREMSALLDGRKVDLRMPEDISCYFRDTVLEEAEVQYEVV